MASVDVIPANAAIHDRGLVTENVMDPGLRRGDNQK
jgi:hypothetical protein